MQTHPRQKTITKQQFIARLAQKHRRSQRLYTELVNEVLDGLSEQLASGHTVRLTGFGTFAVQLRKARAQRDIRTGQVSTLPAHRAVHFRTGEVLKARVRQG